MKICFREMSTAAAVLALCCIGCRRHETAAALQQFSNGAYRDGTYVGEQTVWPVKAQVEVTIVEGRITDIKLSGHRAWKGKDAGPVVVKQILEKQSTNVDAVSGATMSSTAIMQATQRALDQAGTRKGG